MSLKIHIWAIVWIMEPEIVVFIFKALRVNFCFISSQALSKRDQGLEF